MGEIDLANFISHLVIYMVVLLLAISIVRMLLNGLQLELAY